MHICVCVCVFIHIGLCAHTCTHTHECVCARVHTHTQIYILWMPLRHFSIVWNFAHFVHSLRCNHYHACKPNRSAVINHGRKCPNYVSFGMKDSQEYNHYLMCPRCLISEATRALQSIGDKIQK